MKDSFSMILAVIFLVILIIILPLYNFFERQDDMSYNVALKSVTMFVDEVAQNGYIDQNMYNKFIERLAVTGNTYDIEIEAKKKVLTSNPDEPDSSYIEQYKAYYNKDIFTDGTGTTSTIVDKDNSLINGAFFLDVGDSINVRIKNTNVTMASALLNIISQNLVREKINIMYGATIKNNNWEKATVSQLFQSDILVTINLDDPNEADDKNGFPKYNFDLAEDRILRYKVKVLNADDNNIIRNIKENIKLVGTNPSCYISIESITDGSDEGEYIIEFSLKPDKQNTYFRDSEYNVFYCMLPANSIQGNFTKNASVSSSKILYTINGDIDVPEL